MNRKITTQRTDKKWKVLHLLGWVALILGAISCFGSTPTQPGALLGGALIGVALQVCARIGAWWSNA